eukprot:COSAG04_NODE_6279_length_1366_cov_4.560379_2_plen_193_part_00
MGCSAPPRFRHTFKDASTVAFRALMRIPRGRGCVRLSHAKGTAPESNIREYLGCLGTSSCNELLCSRRCMSMELQLCVAASCTQSCRPMPAAPPVTTATCPALSCMRCLERAASREPCEKWGGRGPAQGRLLAASSAPASRRRHGCCLRAHAGANLPPPPPPLIYCELAPPADSDDAAGPRPHPRDGGASER